MDDPEAPPLRRLRIPSGLLGMIGLVLLAESLLTWLEPALLGIEPWDWRRAGRAISQDGPRASEILCFGDSLVKLGVIPQVVEARSGRSSYNFALCAGRAPASYFLLRRALGRGARPLAVVVDFNPSFLAEPPSMTLRLYADLLGQSEAIELAATARDPGLLGSLAIAAGFRSARDRFEIRRAVVELIRGGSNARGRAAAAAHRNWQLNRGAQVMPRTVARLSADPAAWSWVQPGPWAPDPTNAAYVGRFFELAARHEIPVFWLLPPVHPGFAARQVQTGQEARHDAFVEATARKFHGVVVVDARPSRYDASVFVDMAHLDRQGAATLSYDLAGVIADHLGHLATAPRRVALPPFADRTPAVPLEDLAQSDLTPLAR